MTTPVTNDAAALHSQTTGPATSCGLPKRAARRAATVRSAPAVKQGRAGQLGRGGGEHVCLGDDRGLAEAKRQRVEAIAPSREEADACARCGEALRDRAAENTRRTGHHDDPVFETEQLRY